MIVQPFPRFLTAGSAQLPTNIPFVAVGIHSSSEVDMIEIDGVRCGVGDLVPAAPGMTIKAVRRPASSGEFLSLVLFDKCEELVKPGPRVPAAYRVTGNMADLPNGATDPVLLLAIPFQGRAQCAISFEAGDTGSENFELYVIGHRVGFVEHSAADQYTQDPDSPQDWWNGADAAPTDVLGRLCSRTINIGGSGDDSEVFDEYLVYARRTGLVEDGSGDTYTLIAEAWGERSRL